MKIKDFRLKIKSAKSIKIEGKNFKVREVVKFRFDDGNFYIKCFLNDGYVLADDESNNFYLLVQETKTNFKQPFAKKINYEGKEFIFLYSAHATAEETFGEEIFKKCESESFWDYKASDKSYLSLGVIDSKNERLDFYGKIVEVDNVSF